MGFWSKFACFNPIYQSRLHADECIERILASKGTFGTDCLNPYHYEYRLLSKNQIYFIFKGSRFGKAVKTEYLATFYNNSNGCRIVLTFQHELLGLPPMTSEYHLDIFMKEKMHAYR